MTDPAHGNRRPTDEPTLRIIRVVGDTLGLNDEERSILADVVGYKRLKKWTSARHAEVIVAIEDEFDIEIAAKDIARLSDIAKVDAYIRQATS